MSTFRSRFSAALVASSLAIALGVVASSCSRYAAPPSADAPPTAPGPAATGPTGSVAATTGEEAAEHDHRSGSAGGVISSLGDDQYHTEAVLQSGGALVLFTLGADETKIQEVPQQVLTAYVQPQGSSESFVMILQAEPLPSDSAEMTSRFLGELPEAVRGKPFSATIPALRIGGERFAVRFDSPAATAEPAMPAPRGIDEARELYLTAEGLYTEADIVANGRMTAAEKYAGFRANHNRAPKPGTPICPITETEASPECSWIIGGETYTFCCPPCIDEFLALAKEHPEQVLEPQAYIHLPQSP
ncbi:hypothetical protein [Candidatus Laterigemmans baculatus]|uniref:hypothetical protein n=1 Tax=Candidatus Laterigemmans baculatus TaxID=2770505 RepID=UPI0013DD1F4E|nr:hypothetical protein [Candidatus Laterigemmans baculatus]